MHDTWDAVAHRSVEDIPVLEGAIATLWCDLHDIADGGDHSVVVGHVTHLERAGSPEAEPLLFTPAPYRSLERTSENARQAPLVPAHQRRLAL